MLYSMTGFGSGEAKCGNVVYKIELRALNGKNLDVNIKLPNKLRAYEGNLRSILNELQRGKVDVQVTEEHLAQTGSVEGILNIPLMQQYYQQLSQFVQKNQIQGSDILRAIMMMPEVIHDDSSDVEQEEIEKSLNTAAHAALKKLTEYRKNEGISQLNDLAEKLTNIEKNATHIVQFESGRITRLREKFVKELKSLGQEIALDRERLEMEMIFYIEKLDINEEKVRLKAHIDYFREVMNDDSILSKGKKLGFISQEMGREVNTIGSKANDADIQKLVVLMKDDIEKIKEQVNNIL